MAELTLDDPLFRAFLFADYWKWSKRGNEYRDYKGFNIAVYQNKFEQWVVRIQPVGSDADSVFLDTRRAMRPSGLHFSTCEDGYELRGTRMHWSAYWGSCIVVSNNSLHHLRNNLLSHNLQQILCVACTVCVDKHYQMAYKYKCNRRWRICRKTGLTTTDCRTGFLEKST